MNTTLYSLFGLIPFVLYGINPTIVGKIKAKPIQQVIGTAFSAFLFALIVFFCTFNQSISDLGGKYSSILIGMAVLSGFLWSFGQLLQYVSFVLMDTSKAFAFSTAFCLIMNGLVSVLVFKEWKTPLALGLGFSAIVIAIIGSFLLCYKDKRNIEEIEEEKKSSKKEFAMGLLVILISCIFLVGFSLVPRFATDAAKANGEKLGTTSILLPQAIAMVISVLIIGFSVYFYNLRKAKKNPNIKVYKPIAKKTFEGMLPGLFFAGGSFGQMLGVTLGNSAIAFTLGQLSVALATVCALIFLKEYKGKTKKELALTIFGVSLILCGGVMIGFTNFGA